MARRDSKRAIELSQKPNYQARSRRRRVTASQRAAADGVGNHSRGHCHFPSAAKSCKLQLAMLLVGSQEAAAALKSVACLSILNEPVRPCIHPVAGLLLLLLHTHHAGKFRHPRFQHRQHAGDREQQPGEAPYS